MTCGDLAFTGQPLSTLLILAVAALTVGLLLIISARTRRGRKALLAVVVVLAAVIVGEPAGPGMARAAEPICGESGRTGGLTIQAPTTPVPPSGQNADTADSPFDIGQISSNVGIAPGVGAAPITGRIVNHGSEAIFVAAITVEIASVTKAAGATEGPCDATDYALNDPVMPVGLTLQPGDSAVFSGASIGFLDKPLNQDACQAAVVGLAYFSS